MSNKPNKKDSKFYESVKVATFTSFPIIVICGSITMFILAFSMLKLKKRMEMIRKDVQGLKHILVKEVPEAETKLPVPSQYPFLPGVYNPTSPPTLGLDQPFMEIHKQQLPEVKQEVTASLDAPKTGVLTGPQGEVQPDGYEKLAEDLFPENRKE